MTRWNPSDPAVIGPELLAKYNSSLPVLGRGVPVVQGFRSNAAETIAAARIHTGVSAGGEPAVYLAEIVAEGNEVDDGAFTTVTYAPNLLAIIAGNVNDGNGTPGSAAVTAIDEWPPVYTDIVSMGPAASFDLEFGSGGLAATGRIAAVAVEVVTTWGTPLYPSGFPDDAGTDMVRRTVVSLFNGGVFYGTHTRVIPVNNAAGTAGRYFYTWGEINPITGQPWTQADVRAFDTSTTRVRLARGTGDDGAWRTAAVRLVVVYENTERRLARGVLTTATAADPSWSADIALASPAGAANWAKALDTNYALLISQADQGNLTPAGPNTLILTTVDTASSEAAPADLPSYTGRAATITHLTDGNVSLASQVATSKTASRGRLFPFVLRTATSTTSADGQPYVAVLPSAVFFGSGSSQGELRTSASATYAGLRLMLGWDPAVPTDELIIAVKRRSDDVLVGRFIITPEDLLAVPESTIGELVLVETRAVDPGFALTSGTQYYLDFSSASTVVGWIIGLLAVQAGGGGVLYQEATYGGGTDQADPIQGMASTGWSETPGDWAAVLDAEVDKPANFTATAALTPLPDEQPCPLDGIPHVALAWEATAVGADFASYQLERLDADGTTWQQIAGITDEAVTAAVDQEARLGVAESYRLRMVRTDGASSYYTPTAVATAVAAGCGYTFTSNEAPDMAVGYPDTYNGQPIRTYQFPEAAEVQFRTMYGRDYQVAFHPLARRGVTFERTLNIGGMAAPAAGVGPPAAALLRDLAWASLSYVCVRDQDGNRWFTNIRVSDLAAYNNQGDAVHVHWVTVVVVEVTTTPSFTVAVSGTISSPAEGPFSFVSGEPILFVDGTPMDAVDQVVLSLLAWDTDGQGWDEAAWSA